MIDIKRAAHSGDSKYMYKDVITGDPTSIKTTVIAVSLLEVQLA